MAKESFGSAFWKDISGKRVADALPHRKRFGSRFIHTVYPLLTNALVERVAGDKSVRNGLKIAGATAIEGGKSVAGIFTLGIGFIAGTAAENLITSTVIAATRSRKSAK